MSQETHDPLLLPALRAHMGDWIYYITFMKMADISGRVRVARDIHRSKALNEYIQRQLKKSHAHGITKYLVSQPQRMFNAMVIGVYEGSPDWYELSVGPGRTDVQVSIDEFPSYIDGALGMLRLDGGEKLFAIDGQHRVVGIQRAVAEKPELGDEEVSAIFVAHRNDPAGLQRTRRLFTTLNKTAKRVTKADIIALDEDDVVAIVTRRLIDEYPLFADPYLTNAGTKSLPVTDMESFTNIITLYDCVDVYLGKPNKAKRMWQEYKDIDERYEQVRQLWDSMARYFEPLGQLQAGNPSASLVATLRNRSGGHLLFRPIGLMLVVTVIRQLMDSGVPLDEAVHRVSEAPMILAEPPWVSLLWDAINRRMITAAQNQKIGAQVLLYGVNGSLTSAKTDEEQLTRELAGLLNRQVNEITLQRYVQT